MTIKAAIWLAVGVLVLAAPACHPKGKEITPLQRKTAANLASEAEFAVTLRDFTRAAQLYTQAAELCPDDPGYWMNAGIARRRLDQRGDAKRAYEAALGIFREAYAHDRKNPQALLQQVRILALLGRADEARAVLEKARSELGDDPGLRGFTAQSLDQMMTDPDFKSLAL